MATDISGESPEDAINKFKLDNDNYKHLWPHYVWYDSEWKAVISGDRP